LIFKGGELRGRIGCVQESSGTGTEATDHREHSDYQAAEGEQNQGKIQTIKLQRKNKIKVKF
jgi:uncharacterized protein YfiM (DUF2279 family)